jgi:multidrug efflux pump subunit AcrA (membrane-fusion protein)
MNKLTLKQSVVLGASLMLFSAGLFGAYQMAMAHGDDEPEAAPEAAQVSTNALVEMVEADGLKDLGSSSYSWPGEILSTSDVEVHPVREGQIAEWRVKLGQTVKKGQVLGRLTAPPATIELNSALAARTEALVRARAQEEATQRLVQESRSQLDTVRLALERNRDTALSVADREAEQAVRSKEGAAQELSATQSNREASLKAAQAELDAVQTAIPLKRQALRVSIERLAQRTAGRLTYSGASPSDSIGAAGMSFKWGVGIGNSSVQDQYRRSLGRLLDALKDPNAVPDALALEYVDVSLKLLSSSIGGTENFPQSELNDARTELTDDQKEVIDTLNEYKDAQAQIALKQAEVAKTTAERDRELASANTAALNTDLASQGAVALKNKLVAEADTEYVKEKSELDAKISELNRELRMAQAEVDAAEAAYGVMAAGVAGQDIVAPQNGVVSSLFKVLGDHVAPETAIAGISSAEAKGRFVRFKIPGDMRVPEVGEEVAIERPGFAVSNVKAKVTGIGLALDEAGSYTADAEFTQPTDWPVHASIRVTSEHKDEHVFVPMTAVWFDDAGASHVWLVMENNKIRPQEVNVGRTFGDKVEIEEGLSVGDRYIAKSQSGMKTGQSIEASTPATQEKSSSSTVTDESQPHSHDE